MTKKIKPIFLSFLLLIPTVALAQENSNSTDSSSSSSTAESQGNTQGDSQQTPTNSSSSAGESTSSAPPAQSNTPPSESQQNSKADTAASAATEALKASKEEEQKTKEKEARTEEVIEKGGLIAGKFQISITEAYTHIQTSQLYISGFGILPILIVGNIDVQNVRRDIFSTTLSSSYKLTDRSQVSISVPWQHVMADTSKAAGISGKTVIGSSQEKKTQSSSLGDISVGVSYRLIPEGLTMPSISTFVNFKTRTGRDFFETADPAAHVPAGTGFYSLSASLSWSKSSAPAVVYGSIGYGYNFPRKNIPYTPASSSPILIKSYEPGPSFNISTGVSVSLNYQLSLSWSVAQSHNFSSRINGHVSSNSETNSITFSMGATWRYSDKTYLNVSLTSGLSPDAGGTTFSARVPWNF